MFLRTARQAVVAVVGATVVLVGVAMIVLPGPAIVVVPAGLAILATEFAWAKRLLKRMRQRAASMFPGKTPSPSMNCVRPGYPPSGQRPPCRR
jgi:uncharacterized protein (TIGR02611 family)